MATGSKIPPSREEGWWWEWKTPTSCFDAKEVGKIEDSPPRIEMRDGGLVVRIWGPPSCISTRGRVGMAPHALKREMEGWWWGLGTSVSCFDAREGGEGRKQPPSRRNTRWRATGGDWGPPSRVSTRGRVGMVENNNPSRRNTRWRAAGGDWVPLSRFSTRGRVGKVENSPPRVETRDGGLVVGTGDLHLAFRCEGG